MTELCARPFEASEVAAEVEAEAVGMGQAAFEAGEKVSCADSASGAEETAQAAADTAGSASEVAAAAFAGPEAEEKDPFAEAEEGEAFAEVGEKARLAERRAEMHCGSATSKVGEQYVVLVAVGDAEELPTSGAVGDTEVLPYKADAQRTEDADEGLAGDSLGSLEHLGDSAVASAE